MQRILVLLSNYTPLQLHINSFNCCGIVEHTVVPYPSRTFLRFVAYSHCT